MLQERRIWKTLRRLEKGGNPIPLDDLMTEVRKDYPSFKNDEYTKRVIQKMVDKNLIYYENAVVNNKSIVCIKSRAISDQYYTLPYFWPKFVDEIGMWKIFTAIIGIAALIPGTLANELVTYIFRTITHLF